MLWLCTNPAPRQELDAARSETKRLQAELDAARSATGASPNEALLWGDRGKHVDKPTGS